MGPRYMILYTHTAFSKLIVPFCSSHMRGNRLVRFLSFSHCPSTTDTRFLPHFRPKLGRKERTGVAGGEVVESQCVISPACPPWLLSLPSPILPQKPRPSRTLPASLAPQCQDSFHPHILQRLPLRRPRHRGQRLAVRTQRLLLPGRSRRRIHIGERAPPRHPGRPRGSEGHQVRACSVREEPHITDWEQRHRLGGGAEQRWPGELPFMR